MRVVIPGASKCILFPCIEISISAMRGSSRCVIHIPSFVANTQCLKYIYVVNTSYYRQGICFIIPRYRIHLLIIYSNYGMGFIFYISGPYTGYMKEGCTIIRPGSGGRLGPQPGPWRSPGRGPSGAKPPGRK